MNGEVKRGEVCENAQGLKGTEGGEMREKGWEERGPKAHERKTLILVPLWFRYFLVAFRFEVKTFIPATEPPDPRRVSEGVSERVSEWFLKGFWRGQPKDPSKRLQNAFMNPSKTFQEGVEIDDALGFPGLRKQFQGPGVL